MNDSIDLIKKFSLVVPLNRPIHVADDEHFTGTDLACIAKLVTAANRGGLKGHTLKSMLIRRGKDDGEIQFEFSWE